MPSVPVNVVRAVVYLAGLYKARSLTKGLGKLWDFNGLWPVAGTSTCHAEYANSCWISTCPTFLRYVSKEVASILPVATRRLHDVTRYKMMSCNIIYVSLCPSNGTLLRFVVAVDSWRIPSHQDEPSHWWPPTLRRITDSLSSRPWASPLIAAHGESMRNMEVLSRKPWVWNEYVPSSLPLSS